MARKSNHWPDGKVRVDIAVEFGAAGLDAFRAMMIERGVWQSVFGESGAFDADPATAATFRKQLRDRLDGTSDRFDGMLDDTTTPPAAD
jgi:hypothetical protein